MASNGLLNRPKTGVCRICQRARHAFKDVLPVGEVHRGYATGYVWECRNHEQCVEVAVNKLQKENLKVRIRARIENALQQGRLTGYPIYV